MSRFSKGDWVCYSGPSEPFGKKLGQVIGHYKRHYDRSIVMVRFISGRDYGCWPEFLTKVDKRKAAVEVARVALS